MMELQHLRTLQAVAEAGSLTRAAQTLHLTQPAVSAHIKALEAELGVQLFRRTARGMALTDAGQNILALAQGVLDGATAIWRAAERLRGDVSGTLRLGTMDCGFDVKLARIVGMISQRHPELEVTLETSTSGRNRRAVLDQDLDAAFVEGWFEDDRLVSVHIGSSRLGVIGPAAWAAELDGAGWSDLARLPWVFQSKDCSYCALLERISEQEHVTFTPQFRAEAFGAVKDLVAEGLALSIADLDDCAPQVSEGVLAVWPGYTFDMPVRLITLRQRAQEPMLTSLTEIARQVHAPAHRRRAKALGTASQPREAQTKTLA